MPKPAWLQHLGHKFQEVLQVNAKSMQGVPDSIPLTSDSYGGSTPVLDVGSEHVSLKFPRFLSYLKSEVVQFKWFLSRFSMYYVSASVVVLS